MTIPPIPSEDLAKLVLGYLAEEQLMTAYDEFLQSSPYLDAHRNEYDRLFMKSLKNIMAEYIAVKIYVETCRPVALRRGLFGCTNLLEVVKFLVQHIDVNKLHGSARESAHHRVSSDNVETSQLKATVCDVCNAQTLLSCNCKSKLSCAGPQITKSHIDTSTSNSFVDTTLLENLPGNTVRKKHVKVLEKDCKMFLSSSSYEQSIELTSKQQSDGISVASLEQNSSNNSNTSHQIKQNCLAPHNANNVPVKTLDTIDSKQKIEELNDILNIVGAIADRRCHNNVTETVGGNCTRESTAGSFQDFATGVNGKDYRQTIVPDSSTTENINAQVPIIKEPNTMNTEEIKSNNSNDKEVPKPHFLFKLGTVKSNSNSQMNSAINRVPNMNNIASFRAYGIRPKPNEQRIKILSDVKVDKTFKNNESNQTSMPAVLQNATSTPLTSVQTIVINGTPAYRHEPKLHNFTKDEIMAMPTIILVPSSGTQIPPGNQSRDVSDETVKSATSTISSAVTPLGPITIDVSTNASLNNGTNIGKNSLPSLTSLQEENSSNAMLIKTVDVKNASLPKDVVENSNKNTPHTLPPKRKSSSTPRRSTHVRVLDFTTPRRILQETINEHVSNENSSPVETIVSRSPNLHTFVHTVTGENISTNETSACTKENNHTSKPIIPKKCNWDTDLRALAVANEKDNRSEPVGKVAKKPKPNTAKKKKLSLSQSNDKLDDKKSNHKRTSKDRTSKTSKTKRKFDEVIEDPIIVVDDSMSAPIKPTINIIAGPDWGISSREEDEKNKSKANDEEPAYTPEMDRTSLQNVIGAKLNISDLLETPYKQALYDIQMETPRFLGPDLPGDPMSDIKIMNIPTPRFLNTPKPPQATPSSYSSRPTDYSSGGSYYKPDDQDYLPGEDIDYSTTSTKEKKLSISTTSTVSEHDCKDTKVRSSRPVRKCTKNVSYYNCPCIKTKTKEASGKAELDLPCSDKTSANSLCHNKIDDETAKPLKGNKSRQTKVDTAKKNNTSRKHRTPVKKETKTFMKIKPRRPTPTKAPGIIKRKTSEPQSRKRTYSKGKPVNVTPAVTSAPTKSRRKSSTPRKLPCTKTFVSESSGHDSPELVAKNKQNATREPSIPRVLESDTEQLALQWSDDGSQDAKSGVLQINPSINESDDITKIQEFIATSYKLGTSEHRSNLHDDLVKRGFDIETAKIIERDLLDTPPYQLDNTIRKSVDEIRENETLPDTTQQSDGTCANLQIDEETEGDYDEIELSVHECNEETENYITYSHDDTKDTPKIPLSPKLRDKFSMEVCIDGGVAIRVRLTPFTVLLDQRPQDVIETEMAVSSITNMDKLYTPMKESIKAQCYEIFDSTLTSLDTPLKPHGPKLSDPEVTVSELVLDVEKEVKEKTEAKKRKRLQSGNSSDDSTNENKRSKPEPQYLLNSANIQNIDIETVLYKLHGP